MEPSLNNLVGFFGSSSAKKHTMYGGEGANHKGRSKEGKVVTMAKQGRMG
jgi:hypothetical protein